MNKHTDVIIIERLQEMIPEYKVKLISHDTERHYEYYRFEAVQGEEFIVEKKINADVFRVFPESALSYFWFFPKYLEIIKALEKVVEDYALDEDMLQSSYIRIPYYKNSINKNILKVPYFNLNITNLNSKEYMSQILLNITIHCGGYGSAFLRFEYETPLSTYTHERITITSDHFSAQKRLSTKETLFKGDCYEFIERALFYTIIKKKYNISRYNRKVLDVVKMSVF